MPGSVNRSPALLPKQRGATRSDSRGGRQSVQSAYRAESAAGGKAALFASAERNTMQFQMYQNLFKGVFGNSPIFSSFQDARRATELEEVMEKQKMKVDLKLESSTL